MKRNTFGRKDFVSQVDIRVCKKKDLLLGVGSSLANQRQYASPAAHQALKDLFCNHHRRFSDLPRTFRRSCEEPADHQGPRQIHFFGLLQVSQVWSVYGLSAFDREQSLKPGRRSNVDQAILMREV